MIIKDPQIKKTKKNFFDYKWCKGKNLDYDFFSVKKGRVDKRNFPTAFFPIVGIFSEDCNFKLKKCYSSMNRLFVDGYFKGKSCELMLRYAGYYNELIVARVEFIHRRRGKMTELYRILKLIQKEYKTGRIVIESVQTDEMKNWCIKNGFIEDQCRPMCYIEGQ
jgi:hypothetical protein